MSPRFAGCHGFLVEPESVGLSLGWTTVAPPLRCRVGELDEASIVRRELIWRSEWPGDGDRPAMWEEAWRDDEDALVFVTGHRPTVGQNEHELINVDIRA